VCRVAVWGGLGGVLGSFTHSLTYRCSTGTPAQDREVAEAGVKAVEEYIKSMETEGGGQVKAKL